MFYKRKVLNKFNTYIQKHFKFMAAISLEARTFGKPYVKFPAKKPIFWGSIDSLLFGDDYYEYSIFDTITIDDIGNSIPERKNWDSFAEICKTAKSYEELEVKLDLLGY